MSEAPTDVGPAVQCRAMRDVRVAGSPDALISAAEAVQAHLCREHGLLVRGQVTMLTQELVWQVLERRRERPLVLDMECDVDAITVSVAVSGLGPAVFAPHGDEPRWSHVVSRIADDYGVEPRASGVRLWASVRTGAEGRAGERGDRDTGVTDHAC